MHVFDILDGCGRLLRAHTIGSKRPALVYNVDKRRNMLTEAIFIIL